MFGWRGRGFGWRRWMAAMAVGDPDRALFGLGPCGEAAYRAYKEGRAIMPAWNPTVTVYDEIEKIKKDIEEIKKKLENISA